MNSLFSYLVLSIALVGQPVPEETSSLDTLELMSRTTGTVREMPAGSTKFSEALDAAIAECGEEGTGEIRFDGGAYDLSDYGRGGEAVFTFEGLDAITIDGQGADFVFDGRTLPFLFRNCGKVVLKNFSVDCSVLPYYVGTVLTVTPEYFDVAVAPEFTVVDGQSIEVVLEFDPETKRHLPFGLDVHNGVSKTERIDKHHIRAYTPRRLSAKVGNLVSLCHRWYGPGAMVFERCGEVLLQGTTIYSAHGMGLRTHRCGDVTLDEFEVRIKPGTERLMSVTADAAHFSGGTGTIAITDSLFEGNGDDAINIKSGLYLTVTKIIDDTTLLARHRLGHHDPPFPGDVMEVVDAGTILTLGAIRVKSVAVEPNGVQRIVFEEALPACVEVGRVLGNATAVPKVRIRNCIARNSRARGFLFESRDIVVEDCEFSHLSTGAISAGVELAQFAESITLRDVTIRNNTFTHVNHKPGQTLGVIGILAFVKGYAFPTQPGVHRNILIEGNTINDTAVSAIFAAGVDGLVIKNNTIKNVCQHAVRSTETAVIDLMSCRNVTVEANTMLRSEQGEDCEALVRHDRNSEDGSILVKGNVQ